MAYDQNIPKPGDILKTSQAQLLANFQSIQTLVAVNHGNFDSSVQGKHTFIQFPVQGGDPATGLGEVALYSKNGATSTVPELAFERQSNGSISVFTEGGQINEGDMPNGYTRLPSGFLIKWGRVVIPAGGNSRPDTITILPTNPVFTNVYHAEISYGIANGAVNPSSITYLIDNQLTTTQFGVLTQTTSIIGGWVDFTLDYFIIGS